MSDATRNALVWGPRVLGILVALFLGIFALDAFSETTGFWKSLGAFLLHLTPTYMVLGVVYIAWKRPWFGALIFLAFAVLYALSSLDHPNWILTIALPLAGVGILYLLSGRAMRPAR